MTTTTAPPSAFTPQRFFRGVALAEAVTWTLLIAAMIAKYGFDAGDLPVRVAGGLHGFVFIVYAFTALVTGLNQRWAAGVTAGAVATAVVPWATIPFDRWAHRTGRLEGPWRTQATADPRDGTVVDRALRWLLTHPVLFVVGFVVTCVVVMSVLLMLGPPTEWGS